MAKLIRNLKCEPDNSSADVEEFVLQSVEEVANYLSNEPLNVNYYSTSLSESLKDMSLYSVDEILGVDSPLVYTRIKNFPFFNYELINEISTTDNGGTQPQEQEITGTAITCPFLCAAKVDDLFTVPNSNYPDHIFRISNVVRERLDFFSLTKIDFYLYKLDSEVDLPSQTIANKVIRSYSSCDDNVIQDEETVDDTDKLECVLETLYDYYIKYYYDDVRNTLWCPYDSYRTGLEKAYVSFDLIRFCRQSKIFEKRAKIQNQIFLEPSDEYDEFFDEGMSDYYDSILERGLVFEDHLNTLLYWDTSEKYTTDETINPYVLYPVQTFFIQSLKVEPTTVITDFVREYSILNTNLSDTVNNDVITSLISDEYNIDTMLEEVNKLKRKKPNLEDYLTLPVVIYELVNKIEATINNS